MEEVNVTVCGRAGEVAGDEPAGRADADEVGAETFWLEQPTASSPTVATANVELNSGEAGYERGFLRSIEVARHIDLSSSCRPSGVLAMVIAALSLCHETARSDRIARSPGS
jgi:hypothetical protein